MKKVLLARSAALKLGPAGPEDSENAVKRVSSLSDSEVAAWIYCTKKWLKIEFSTFSRKRLC